MLKYILCSLFSLCVISASPAMDFWQFLEDEEVFQWALHGPNDEDAYHGTNTQKLLKSGELKKPAEPIIVAVIDSGFDLDHSGMKGIWKTNEAEANGAVGVDDDKNGYVDDIRGWNFVGGKDGKNVVQGRLEIVREIKRLETLAAQADLDDTQQNYLKSLKAKMVKKRAQHGQRAMRGYYMLSLCREAKRLAEKKGIDLKDHKAIAHMEVSSPEEWLGREALLMVVQNGMNEAAIQQQIKRYTKSMITHFDKDFSESEIIGDDPLKMDDIGYGNTDLSATRGHGTAVTSLIAAHGNPKKMIGQCPKGYVKVIPIRAVPDGDERDKDVANALRYAVDQGAKVVNMSFGKYYSPNKEYVDQAFAYALEKGVIVVTGAGNDGVNVAKNVSYPNAFPKNHEEHKLPKQFPHVLTVGASTEDPEFGLVTEWSNYSKERVHLFAPGGDVLCAEPGNKYDTSDGTSLASPLVAGAAALLWSQFPDKSWKEIHDAIMKGVRTYPDLAVDEPGTYEESNLSKLSISGGLLDVWRSYQYLKTGKLP